MRLLEEHNHTPMLLIFDRQEALLKRYKSIAKACPTAYLPWQGMELLLSQVGKLHKNPVVSRMAAETHQHALEQALQLLES